MRIPLRLLGFVLMLAALVCLPTRSVEALPKVLILHANPTDRALDVQSKLQASGKFGTVDMYDMGPFGTVPTLNDLIPYDAIITFTNYQPNTGVGDVVAQYIERGGGVVNGVFSIINDYRGLYTSSTYEALVPGNAVSGTEMYLGSIDLPSHPLVAGVNSFDGGSGSFHSDATSVEPGAYVVARWDDKTPLIIAKENVGAKNARIVDLNFFLPSNDVPTKVNYWHANTDGAVMMVNALLWVIPPPPSQLSTSPKSMDFQSVKVGDSVNLCGTIANTGTGTLFFKSISFSGAADYSLASGPALTDSVVAGASTSFCVKFKPSTNGTRNATLNFVTNGRDSGSQSINLTGIGTAPAITLNVTELFRRTPTRVGDTTKRCFPVRSTGTGPLRIDSVLIGGINNTSYYVVSYPRTVALGATDSVCIGFIPNFEGRTDAIATVYSNAINTPQATVHFSGNGTLGRFVMTPSVLNFDSVAIGETSCKTVTLSNPGTDTLRILKNYSTGSDYDFIFTPLTGTDTVILPDHSVPFNVCFRPLSRGTRIARYAFRTSIAPTFEAPRRDTGLVILNVVGTGVANGILAFGETTLDSAIIGEKICQEDTIFNLGNDNVTITSGSLMGADSADFELSSITYPVTLQPGAWTIVHVCTTPTRRGLNNTNLVLNGTANGKAQTITLPLFTKGLQVCAQSQPAALFTKSLVMVGASDTMSFTVTNCGDVPTSYTAAIPAGADYTVTPATSAVIAPNATATFLVTFTPTAVGTRVSTATVTGGTGVSPMQVSLAGSGAGITATATGEAGTVAVGDCKEFDVTITNSGNIDWTPGTPVINGGTNPTDFTIVSGPTPTTIAPNGTAVVVVKFCPLTHESQETANLTFPSAAPSTTFSYTLTGTGAVAGVAQTTEQNGFVLGQNYPNPVSGQTQISFTTPTESSVTITMLDAKGSVVKTLTTGRTTVGEHTINVNTRDLASGTYYYVLESANAHLVRQMSIVK